MNMKVFRWTTARSVCNFLFLFFCTGSQVKAEPAVSGVFTGQCWSTPYAALSDSNRILIGFSVPYFNYSPPNAYSELSSNMTATTAWSNSQEQAIVEFVRVRASVAGVPFHDVRFREKLGDDIRARILADVATNAVGVTNGIDIVTIPFDTYRDASNNVIVSTHIDTTTAFTEATQNGIYSRGYSNSPNYDLQEVDRVYLHDSVPGITGDGSNLPPVEMLLCLANDYYRVLESAMTSNPALADLVAIAAAADGNVTNFIYTAYSTNGFPSEVVETMLASPSYFASIMTLLGQPHHVRVVGEIGAAKRRIIFLQPISSEISLLDPMMILYAQETVVGWRLLPLPDWSRGLVSGSEETTFANSPDISMIRLAYAFMQATMRRTPKVFFDQDQIVVSSAESSVYTTVSLSWPATNDVVIALSLEEGDGRLDLISSNVVIEKGSLVQTVRVSVLNNPTNTLSSVALLRLSVQSGGAMKDDRASIPITLQHIPLPPMVGFEKDSMTATSENGPLRVPLTLSWATTSRVVVSYYQISSLTDTNGGSIPTNSVVFESGVTRQELVCDTSLFGTSNGWFRVKLDDASNAVVTGLTDCFGVYHYVPNYPLISFSKDRFPVFRNFETNVEISVVASRPIGQTIEIPLIVEDSNTVTNGIDYLLMTNVVQFAPWTTNTTFFVTIPTSGIPRLPVEVPLMLGTPTGGGAVLGDQSNCVVHIEDLPFFFE